MVDIQITVEDYQEAYYLTMAIIINDISKYVQDSHFRAGEELDAGNAGFKDILAAGPISK